MPFALDKEDLKKITNDIYLVLGENDLLFPTEKTIAIVQKNIATLRNIKILFDTSHGIETSKVALKTLAAIFLVPGFQNNY